MVERLIDDFPSFRDIVTYHGRPVAMSKRPQLTAAVLHEKLLDFGLPGFPEEDIKQLTAFVNYNIPAAERSLGVLNYREELAKRVDSQIEVPYGSRDEVEIRALALCVANRIEERVIELTGNKHISALNIDFWLWDYGRRFPSTPHLTITTAY